MAIIFQTSHYNCSHRSLRVISTKKKWWPLTGNDSAVYYFTYDCMCCEPATVVYDYLQHLFLSFSSLFPPFLPFPFSNEMKWNEMQREWDGSLVSCTLLRRRWRWWRHSFPPCRVDNGQQARQSGWWSSCCQSNPTSSKGPRRCAADYTMMIGWVGWLTGLSLY